MPGKIRREYERLGPKCQTVDVLVRNLSDYLAVLSGVLAPSDDVFWFRGHAQMRWNLAPSALRYTKEQSRDAALRLLARFKRFAEMKLERPPRSYEEMKWMQLAQHYGLPTRLLDWTENAAIALYFACLEPRSNGSVFVLNPIDLNRSADPLRPRIFDCNSDSDLIDEYLKLGSIRDPKGLSTIAIHPVWNSERIMLQKGVFTLHGSIQFAMSGREASSLVCLPVLQRYKTHLREELARIGVTEMAIFPEPEHLCHWLKSDAHLL